MKNIILLFLLCAWSPGLMSQSRTIHVYVALCDNENQGIVPVPERLGNGKDPQRNLYWGAMYGIKSFFKQKSKEWEILKIQAQDSGMIMESVLMKHRTEDVFLLAEAYDGEQILPCTQDFLRSANGQGSKKVYHEQDTLDFAGSADLIAYVGHDGLMEFMADVNYDKNNVHNPQSIVLACISESYFLPELDSAGSQAILLTTGLMAPEAYTLEAALNGWVRNDTIDQIRERAAQAYHLYQKCGIRGARNLFSSGE